VSQEFLRIEPLDSSCGELDATHQVVVRSVLRNLLPEWFFTSSIPTQERVECLKEMLPVFTWSQFGTEPYRLSFYLMAPSWPGLYKFFLEMVSRWLIPGQRMDVCYTMGFDLSLPDLGEGGFSLSEITLRMDDAAATAAVRRNLPTFESELRVGAQSSCHAQRILEIKGLASDEKTAMIQENIAELVRRYPRAFDNDIISEMQHFMVACSRTFKAQREFRHISRIICSHYIFRRRLLALSDERHVAVKLIRARIQDGGEVRPVLGLFVGINFLRRNEVLEQQHLLRAVSHSISGVKPVEGSFLANRSASEGVSTLYLELVKSDGARFTFEEERRLRESLEADLKSCIEHQLHPVFMPRNDEEIMRSIVTLSHQLKYVRDLPQVMVNFEEQTEDELAFTVILLRVLRDDDPSIQEMFAQSGSSMRYRQDWIKVVGLLRKRYPKEATLFRLCIPKQGFLRSDHSIDLRRARQTVVMGLVDVVGDVRDFNGGMISKQDELFSQLRERLGSMSRFDELLLENFFYSMTPVVMRSVLEPSLINQFFGLFLKAISGKSGVYRRETEEFAAVMITGPDFEGRRRLLSRLESVAISSLELVSVELIARDRACMGFLLRSDDEEKRAAFLEAVGSEEPETVRALG